MDCRRNLTQRELVPHIEITEHSRSASECMWSAWSDEGSMVPHLDGRQDEDGCQQRQQDRARHNAE